MRDHDYARWSFLGGTVWTLFTGVVGGVFSAVLLIKYRVLENPDAATITLMVTGVLLVTMVTANLVTRRSRVPSLPRIAIAADDASTPKALPPEEGRVFIREENAVDVLKTVQAALPLQREATKDGAYIGRWARWSGRVRIITLERDGSITLHIDQGEGFNQCFAAWIPSARRQTLEPLREGDEVLVEGRIRPWNGTLICLEDASIASHSVATKEPA